MKMIKNVEEHHGLSSAQVEQSRTKYGSNQLTRTKKNSFFKQYLANFGDPIIKILLVALAVNLLFMFDHFDWFETAGVAVAIFLATFVSTLSEHGSESAFEKLQQEASSIQCRVKRANGVRKLPLGEVVVGDLVLLGAGERVPADGILVSGEVSVDQSSLNGESKEAHKAPSGNDHSAAKGHDFMQKNRLFRGSVVCSGEGMLLVQQVGVKTFYGSMAMEVQEDTRESPLKFKLRSLAKTISRFGYVAAAFVALAFLFNCIVLDNGFDPARISAYCQNLPVLISQIIQAVTLAITVVVVAVPEGLPMMITVVLSSNMKRMLKDHVLVRKLVGIETSGSLNILFTDKTGTLTKGKLQVKTFVSGQNQVYTSARSLRKQKELWELVEMSCFFNTSSTVGQEGRRRAAIGGNATDRALLEYVIPHLSTTRTVTREEFIPFNSRDKFSACRVSGKQNLWLVKGAFEKILPQCTSCYDAKGQRQPFRMSPDLQRTVREMSGSAVRILALAVSDTPIRAGQSFPNLTLLGLIGIRDELKSEAGASIRQITGAGIQVVMMTGDSRETATAIALEAGLLRPGQTDAVLDSHELNKMTDEQIRRLLPRLRVVARAVPADKSRLVRAAQELGLVAGMTGDGVNDAPALKKADVGFAMGSGTEVAKEASDIVILDDNLSSIAKAILYGRTIFKSIRKFIIFQLTVNLCAVCVSVIGPFIGIDTPVTVIQMLWINIIMDTLAGLAFAGEAPLPEYLHEPPKRRDEHIINRYMVSQILFTGLYTVLLCLAFLKAPFFRETFHYDSQPIFFLTAFFGLFIFAGIFNSFNARTPRLHLLSHITQNKAFLFIMAMAAGVQLLLIYYGGTLFRTVPLTLQGLKWVLLLSSTVIPIDLIRKLILRLNHRKGNI